MPNEHLVTLFYDGTIIVMASWAVYSRASVNIMRNIDDYDSSDDDKFCQL